MRPRSPRAAALALSLLASCGPLGPSLQSPDGQVPRDAPPPGIVAVRLVDFGTYRSRDLARGAQPDTLHGSGPVSDDLGLERPGALVQARLGTSMGFRYVAEGTPAGAELPVRVVARHPPMTLEGRTLSESSWTDVVRIGRQNRAGWRFEAPYELVPGDWTLEVWHGPRLLVRQAFQVEAE